MPSFFRGKVHRFQFANWCFFASSTQDRPDLVARIFEVKKNILLNEIIKGGVFGRIVGFISVVEYQAKLLLKLF